MSFNRTLWTLTGRQIGREARAMMNVGTAYSTFWAPVINLAREPRWGRNIETPGEDPYLTSQYAIQFTKGMQEAPDDPYHIQASACCKHFVANSMEGTTEKDGERETRMEVNSNVTQQDLIDSYMLPFQACVEQGKVSGLMCSYNSVNGVPSCANDWLLKDVARGEWGFDGYITSDCDADSLVSGTHHYHNDSPEEAVRDILRAGTDNDCGGFIGRTAMSALNQSYITMDDVDERLAKLWRVRIRLGHFDQLGPLDKITPEATICTDYAIQTSMNGMIQSAALLKNDDKTLPLAGATAGTIAVIGPNGNYSSGDTGYYGPKNVCGKQYWTAVDAVAKYASKVVSVAGVPTALSTDTSGIPAAVAMAKAADTVVLVVGTDLKWASEGHDAETITFTDAQTQLIEQVSAAAKKPITVIYMTAVPLDITALIKNSKIGAILHVGQPSVTILGTAELLFGKTSPAGRTIQTIYPEEYQDKISIFDFNMRPGTVLVFRQQFTPEDAIGSHAFAPLEALPCV
jgi:beta-glucosidase-like glycosyl hydrolase